jgi:hypothetical protein
MRFLRFLMPAAAAMLVAACATPDPAVSPASGPVAADAPQYRVGDRWVYRIREGFRTPIVYEETKTVTGVSASGVTVRVAVKAPHFDIERTET